MYYDSKAFNEEKEDGEAEQKKRGAKKKKLKRIYKLAFSCDEFVLPVMAFCASRGIVIGRFVLERSVNLRKKRPF